MFKMDLSS